MVVMTNPLAAGVIPTAFRLQKPLYLWEYLNVTFKGSVEKGLRVPRFFSK